MVNTHETPSEPWLIALDIDGTVMLENGEITAPVTDAVHRVRDRGHEVMLATGRSASMTFPVLDRLDIAPEYNVCSNGAIILGRDVNAPTGYSSVHVETFNPAEVLTRVRSSLRGAGFAVEDETGLYHFTGEFPDASLGANSVTVEFDDLLALDATRVVVFSPEHAVDEFLEIVKRMGLRKVTYNVGWTAWLDIAPEGTNKATALERVREWHEIPRSRVMVVGDGRNDVDMLRWASKQGRGVVMGQAPEDVSVFANESTGSDLEDGLAQVLGSF